MAEFPALPLFTDAYLGDTWGLSNMEHGAYLLMLIVAWRTPGCRLPDDDAKLANITKLRTEQWKRVRPTMLHFWEIRDGYWYQGRLTDEAEFIRKQSKTASAKGRRGAAKRWGTKPAKEKPKQEEMPFVQPLQPPEHCSDSEHGSPPSGDHGSDPNSLNNKDRPIAGASAGQCPSDSNPKPITHDSVVDVVKGENSNFDPVSIAEHLTRIAGVRHVEEKRIVANVAIVREWLALGLEVEHIERTIIEARDAANGPINSLKYFSSRIRRAFAQRTYPKKRKPSPNLITDPSLKKYVKTKLDQVEKEPDTPVEDVPIEEIRQWTEQSRGVALRQGWITREQFDAAQPP